MSGEKPCRCPRAHHEHGTLSRYKTDRCRCADCRAACAAYEANRQRMLAYGRWRRLVPRVGTVRRVQALVADGWSAEQLRSHFGTNSSTQVSRLIQMSLDGNVTVEIAERVAQIYADLSTQEPTGRYQLRSQRHAANQGWAQSWQWVGVDIEDPDAEPVTEIVDDVAIARRVRGFAIELTPNELDQAILRACDIYDNHSPTIAERLNVDVDLVRRVREKYQRRERRAA